ncbi:VCBS repeat-containing protein [Galbibacter sp. BG1]|uniref:VCBS repeat-containing protein n=1 Tax=Galbibacter sp. BG1 TaxID=1170699 RepID=UPI0015BF05EB|nr:VCBS repeat-containing protein [Galbibacter sp. BG1]QLE01958.1 VCBS repeat-containing protein [Galbibacter sp. BG1]
MRLKLIIFLVIGLSCFSCKKSTDEGTVFSFVESGDSGIDFANTIIENEEVNIVDFQYCYNGGGVGIGDFNNDNLPDIVFIGNQVSSRIYLNNGSLNFSDVSQEANFKTEKWITGVVIVDVNADGWDDIYLNVGGADCTRQDCKNLLFVNQGNNENGIPVFLEQAHQYGLDDENYAQQAVFFDYDYDGDLDVYIVHNGNSGLDKNNPVPKKYLPEHLNDVLLRNDFDEQLGHPVYMDVSESAGITHKGFGLGVGINDFDNNDLIDIYVANDFITEDLLYLQKKNKTNDSVFFEESSKKFLGHETYNAMGVDFNDSNNDGLPDILVVDMFPEDYERQKKMLGMMNYERYLLAQRNDYSSQYVHNTLQINNGSLDGFPLKSSEVGFMKGIFSTDWSWAPLMMDMDNDGDRDVYITNGYVKDVTNLDYVNYSSTNNMFGTEEVRRQRKLEYAKNLDSIHLPNFIYENDGNKTYNDVSNDWIPERSSYSNGVAYADFDKDGDLDLVVNNINEKAFLLENKTSIDTTKHYLQINLKGDAKNPHAIGAKVILWENGVSQYHFQSVVRGYLSSVEPIVHFGVLQNTIDSIIVKWPNGKRSKLLNEKSDQEITLKISEANIANSKNTIDEVTRLFALKDSLLSYRHKENVFNDYAVQNLLVRQYSRLGPCVATANVDGEPGDEIFIGGSKGFPGTVWFQDSSNKYIPKQEFDADFEDTDASFFDADGDGDLDLYITSGSTEYPANSKFYKDRLYLNDGEGHFSIAENLIADLRESNNIVRPCDFDQDGDMDLFVGSRIVPGSYPAIPKSTLFLNETEKFTELGNGIFENMGMITDAIWEDVDGDGWKDLLVVGEWMPVKVIKNNKGVLEPMKTIFIDKSGNKKDTEGWWNCIASGDFDKDGDIDFLVGNQGLNGFILPKENKPLFVYNKDFDNNGSLDPVMAQYYTVDGESKLLPIHSRDNIMNQLVILKRKFFSYEQFANTSFVDLLGIESLEKETLQARTFASSYLENLGNGTFRVMELSEECQIAPINDFLVGDFNKDGYLDVLVVGNDLSAETLYGEYDALNGLFLEGSENGFKPIKSDVSGFYVPGQSHHLVKFKDKNSEEFILSTQNDDFLKVFKVQN